MAAFQGREFGLGCVAGERSSGDAPPPITGCGAGNRCQIAPRYPPDFLQLGLEPDSCLGDHGTGANRYVSRTGTHKVAVFAAFTGAGVPLLPPMKRPELPTIQYPNKPKALDKNAVPDRLEVAAVNLKYVPSQYHCPQSDGRPPVGRAKPAMHCPRTWTAGQALIALRTAIRLGQVSKQWISEFPRHVWHLEGDVWYEACTSNGTPGTYHAYPIELAGVPAGLKR